MEKELLEVAHDYYLENANDLPKNNGDVSTVLLDTLYKNNWIDALYVPGKKEVCDTSSWVKVIKEDDEYKYYTYLSCGKYESKTDHVGPTIELNGDSTIVLDLNAPYQELGVKSVKDNQDKTVNNDNVIIDASKIDTSKVGTYEVTYTLEDKLKNKTTVKRVVQVNHYLRQEIDAKTDESKIFKGNVDNNYVWYSGFLWRIMYLTKDDIRLVTDEPVSTIMAGYQITDYMSSDMLKWLNNYFKEHLVDSENIMKMANKWIVNKIANINEREELTLDIGTITLDDYNNSFLNNDTYLNQMNSYALLAYELYKPENDDYNAVKFIERQNAASYSEEPFEMKNYRDYTPMHIRPVIVIDKDTLVYDGIGTKDNPYILTNKKNDSKILNEHMSGEYVIFSNLLWRIVHINKNGTTRLVLNQDIYENGASQLIHVFDQSTNLTFSSDKEGNIGYFLNHEFIKRLNEDKLDYAKFDITSFVFDNGYDGLGKDFIDTKIGTVTMGEILATQPSYAPNPVWLMNGFGKSYAGFVLNGYVTYSNPNFNFYTFNKTVARPVINLKSDVEIISGSGTVNNPYRVK